MAGIAGAGRALRVQCLLLLRRCSGVAGAPQTYACSVVDQGGRQDNAAATTARCRQNGVGAGWRGSVRARWWWRGV